MRFAAYSIPGDPGESIDQLESAHYELGELLGNYVFSTVSRYLSRHLDVHNSSHNAIFDAFENHYWR